MPEAIPSTFFTDSPHWGWIIVFYFFFGGLAGGSFFIGALFDVFGRGTDRPLARLAYYIAFPAIMIGTLLLVIDLGRPERFWHMIVQSETGRPMFKSWSPISFGTWLIALFSLFAFLAFLRALADDGFVRAGRVGGVLGRLPWSPILLIGGLLGLAVAGYTGVLLTVTNRPIWADTSLLGALFLISAASVSAATLILLGLNTRAVTPGSLARLERMEGWFTIFELVALIALVISVWTVAQRIWLSGWGVLLLVGVVGLGMLVPLVIHMRPNLLGGRDALRRASVTAAALAILGGFLLRVVIVLSSEGAPYGG